MSTFGVLKGAIDSWLIRDDVAVTGADMPVILLLTESELAKHLRPVVMEQRATLVATGRFTNLPTDYLAARNPFIDDNDRKFEYRTPEVIRESFVWNGGRAATFYSIEGDDDVNGIGEVRLVLAPPPTVANPLNVEILYWKRFPTLVNDTDTNWLLTNHFDLYLWQALKQAAIYLQEDVLAQTYQDLYSGVRDDLRVSENRKRFRGNQWQSYGNPRTIV